MSYNPQNPNGQATSANSQPVVIASDQSAIPVTVGGGGLAQDTTLTNGNQLTKITDGTQIANTVAGDTGQNALVTAGSHKEVAFSTTTAQAVAATDAGNFRWVSVHIVTQGTNSAITFQCSNDNTNWYSTQMTSATLAQGASTSLAAVGFTGPLTGRYFRLNVSGISAGTTAGVVSFSAMPSAVFPSRDAANGLNTAGSGVANAAAVGQFDDTSPTTITENQFGHMRLSANRNLYGTIRDGAGNERGANVNASNQLSVSVDNTAQVTMLPTATGGWSVNSQTALSNTKVAVKASAGTFGGYMIYNPNAAAIYVQVFDVASGSVTLGSTTPTYVVTIPPAAGANVEFTLGVNHATAITLAATTTATGSTAPSTALTGFFLFK
jgi:hypothetical protein